MFNVTILKMKDIKKIIFIIITIFLVILICKYFSKKTDNKINKIVPKSNMIGCLEQESSVIKNISKEENADNKDETNKETVILQKILETQVSTISKIEDNNEKIDNAIGEAVQEENQISQTNEEPQNIDEAKVRSNNRGYNK